MFKEGLDKQAFRDAFAEHLVGTYGQAWTLFSETPEGRHASGMVFGWPLLGRVLIIGDMVWFPWATKRNVLTAAVNFVNALRDDLLILEFARQKDVPFFERLTEYGLMRRVGVVHDLYKEPAMLFQSQTPQHLRVY